MSRLKNAKLSFFDWTYKPGSVNSNHLSSLIITDKFKPCGSATMKRHEQLVGTNPEYQGVASDRVYSGSMLP